MNKENNIWIEMQGLIDEQLRLQVDIQFEHHHYFLQQHGLLNAKQVIDLGCGNGAFFARMAENNPNTQFIGADLQEHMIATAQQYQSKNLQFTHADLRDIANLPNIAQADGILIRYVLLHIEDAALYLSKLAQAMKPGAHLWIIDLDTEHSHAIPPHPAFDLIQRTVRGFCEHYGKDCNLGSKLPKLIQKAGLSNIQHTHEPFDTDHIELSKFQQFLANEITAYRTTHPTLLTDNEYQQVHQFITDLQSAQQHVKYGVMMLSGKK